MRVIAGRYKGRRLVAPDSGTRPVTDRVKEAVFSSLGDAVLDAEVVDLYAGTGSFGIEAVSRGARRVTFVETAPAALSALRRNLEQLEISARIVSRPVETFVQHGGDVFDLGFCDPPWELPTVELATVLERLAGRMRPGAYVIVSRRVTDPVPTPENLRIDHERRYGDTRIIRYTTEEEDER